MRPRKVMQGKLVASEYQECRAFWQWAQCYPQIREYLVKHVNEGKRTPLQGFQLQAIGMRKGFPDYQLALPRGHYHGLFIEMKTKKSRDYAEKPEQVEWITKLRAAGYYATFAYGCDEAIKVTQDYLANRL